MDPDDQRLWWFIVPLLLVAVVLAVVLALNGAWIAVGISVLGAAYALWATWQSGKPLWPGGPRRGSPGGS